jgi:hypothetical protein
MPLNRGDVVLRRRTTYLEVIMRATCAAIAVGFTLLFATTAVATSVLSTTFAGGAPYYEGPSEAVSTNLSLGSALCREVKFNGRVTAGSSTVNSTVNPYSFAGIGRCTGGSPSSARVNEWTAAFNVGTLSVTINNLAITEPELLECSYKGNVVGRYTNPVPPARAKITIENSATLAYQSGSGFCAGTRRIGGTFDFAAVSPTQDLYLVSR